MDAVRAHELTKWLEPAWFTDLVNVAKAVGMPPADLLLVFELESNIAPWAAHRDNRRDASGRLVRPDPENPQLGYPTAVGLNQITAVQNPGLGITEYQRRMLLTLDAREQMPWVKRSLLLNSAGTPSVVHAYVKNFTPAFLDKASDSGFVIAGKEGPRKEIYDANGVLDFNRDGRITPWDIQEVLRKEAENPRYQAALYRLRMVPGMENAAPRFPFDRNAPPIALGPSPVVLVAGTTLVAAAAALYLTR